MKAVKRPYELRQMLVCTNARDPVTGKPSCGHNGAEALLGQLKKTLKERGLKGRVIATRSGCLDICPDRGCIVGFHPEGAFFHTDCTPEAGEQLLARLTEGL
jgi:predicted metal-binding protein